MRNNVLLFREILSLFLKLWVEKYNNTKKPKRHAQFYHWEKIPNNRERGRKNTNHKKPKPTTLKTEDERFSSDWNLELANTFEEK